MDSHIKQCHGVGDERWMDVIFKELTGYQTEPIISVQANPVPLVYLLVCRPAISNSIVSVSFNHLIENS